MPCDISRIPILSLSTCKGLTDIISELPIPKPTHVSPGSRTLLSEPKLVHAAYRRINNDDEFIVQSVVKALREVSTKSMVFGENLCEQLSESSGSSVLLKSILKLDPYVFNEEIETYLTPPTSELGSKTGKQTKDNASVVQFSRKQPIAGKSLRMDDLKKKKSVAKVYSAVNVAPLRLSLRKTEVVPSVQQKRGRPRKPKILNSKEKDELNEILSGSNSTDRLSLQTTIVPSTSALCESIAKFTVSNSIQQDPVKTNKPIHNITSPVQSACNENANSSVILSEAAPVSESTSFSVTCLTLSQPTTTIKDAHAVQKYSAVASQNALNEAPPTTVTSLTSVVISKPSTPKEPVPPINTIPDVNASTSARRITDPALSQLFQPGLLFHSYLPQNEEEKRSHSGKGLFDDWLDAGSENRGDPPSNVVSTIPNSEGSVSGPSSILGLSVNGLHNPSVSANGDTATCQPRSPLSVPSSFSSYPATPGAPGAVISSQPSMVVSPLSLPNPTQSQPTVSSPSIRLFDNADDSQLHLPTDVSENENKNSIAPRGLAAYLPRTSSFRSSGYFSHLGLANDMFAESVNDNLRHSPKQNLSPLPNDCSSRGFTNLDSYCSSSKLSSSRSINHSGASNHYHYNNAQSRKQLSSRGHFIAGKRKGGHRRRRTELEELKIWNLNENGCAPNDRKPATVHKSASDSNSQPSTVADVCVNSPQKTEFQAEAIGNSDATASLHGGFTEALVERVKRRRQQQDLGHKVPSTRHVTSDVSPRSTPSPIHHPAKNISKPINHELSNMYSEEFSCCDGQSSSSYRPQDDYLSPHYTVKEEPKTLSSFSRSLHERSFCDQKPYPVQSKQSSVAGFLTSNPLKREHVNPGNVNNVHNDFYGLPANFRPKQLRPPEDNDCIVKDGLSEQIPDEPGSQSPAVDPTQFMTKPTGCTISPSHSSNITSELKRSELIEQSPSKPEPAITISRVTQSFEKASDQGTAKHLRKPNLSMSSVFESSKIDTNKCAMDGEQCVRHSPVKVPAFPPSSHRDQKRRPVKGISGLHSRPPVSDTSESNNSSSCSSSTNNESPNNTPVGNHAELSSMVDDGGCPTPSTIPYTHSSAMEDQQSSDSGEFGVQSATRKASRKSRRTRRSSAFSAAGHTSSMSDSSMCVSDQNDSPTRSGGGQDNAPFSSPSSLSTHSEGRRVTSDSEKDARSTGGQAGKCDTALTQFTNRLGEILRRVEELDLLQLTSSDHRHLQTSGGGGAAVAGAGSPNSRPDSPVSLPEAARLTRPELTALYVESARVRLNGSMYSIPTGRLVRFLTLLLVNMRRGSYTKAQPLEASEVSAFLAKRKLTVGSCRTSFDLLSESILWSNPAWCSILTALDCARIALNIVVASDMPRPLLMEDLIDGIVNTVRCHLESGVCNIPNISASKIAPGLTTAQVWCFSTEAIGFRACQIMSLLGNLVRFQPHRFTDNLVIHLTSVALLTPFYSLTTGKGIDRDPRRLKTSTLLRLVAADCSVYDVNSEKSKAWRSSVSRLLLSVWPTRLQWASLAVLSGLYSQYESHRKLICDEVFSALSRLSTPMAQQPSQAKCIDGLRGLWLSTSASVDRCLVRCFRLPASYYFYAQRHRNICFQANGIANERAGNQNNENSSPYVSVHTVTAIFLTLVQGLVQVPGSLSTSSSSLSSTVSSTPVTSNTTTGELSQFHKDERQVLSSYHSSTKHAYYLLSGLFKRTCNKTEVDLRPLLDTLTADLLALVTTAPVEWPVALTFLNALCTLLLQQLNHNSSTHNSNTNNANASSSLRNNAEISSRLKALDTLATLAAGTKQITQMLVTRFASPSTGNADSQRVPRGADVTRSLAIETTDPARLLLAQVRLVGFLSSHMPVVNHWLMLPTRSVERPILIGGEGDSECVRGGDPLDGRLDTADWREQSLFCLNQNRLEATDCLTVTAHRFHLASWLSQCSREQTELSDAKMTVSKTSQRVGELRQLRQQLLSELVLTHHTVPSSLTWLINNLKQLGAIVGSSSHFNSPAQNNRTGGRSGSSGAAELNSGAGSSILSGGSRLAGLAGSFLAHGSPKAQSVVRFAHSRHLELAECVRFTAHSHWSALFLMSTSGIGLLPSDKLFTLLCKLVGEPSIPMRTKALQCLTSLIDRESSLTFTSVDSVNKSISSLGALCDLPRLIHARLHENSTTVREAAVELVSRLLLLHPRSLMPVYYPLLSERVLDKGISVRKSVIRCFRALLIGGSVEGCGTSGPASIDWKRGRQPLVHTEREVEICVKLIRRMHDEESIQKQVTDIFLGLWFTRIAESDPSHTNRVDRRVRSICGVTTFLRPNNFDMLESFIRQILDISEKSMETTRACEQLVSRLLLLVQRYADKSSATASHRSGKKSSRPSLSSLLATLHVLGRCKPDLLSASCCEFLLDLLHSAVVTPSGTASVGPPPPTTSSCSSTPCDLKTTTSSQGASATAASANASLDSQCLFHLVGIVETVLASMRSKCGGDSTSSVEVAYATSETFKSKLHKLQFDLIRLIQRQYRVVVDVAVSCLSTLTSVVLKNYSQVANCFSQFHRLLNRLSGDLRGALSTQLINSTHIPSRLRPSVLRALYSVGLMCKHFTLDQLVLDEAGGSASTSNMVVSSTSNGNYSGLLEEIMDTLMLFAEYAAAPSSTRAPAVTGRPGASSSTSPGSTAASLTNTMHDADLCRKAITGLCFLIRQHDNLLHNNNVKTFLTRFFTDSLSSWSTVPPPKAGNPICDVQCIILENLTHYLVENERQMTVDSKQWSTRHKSESLKEMADQRSSQASAVAQAYLPCVLQHCILSTSTPVRMNALSLISVVLRQGLVHPFQTLSSLVCLQADPVDAGIRSRATHLLVDAEQKAPGFVAMKAASGIQMAYQLHFLCQACERAPCSVPSVIRGASVDCIPVTSLEGGSSSQQSSSTVTVVNHALYTMLRSDRQLRRSFISNLLALFDIDQPRPVSPDKTTETLSTTKGACHVPLGQLVFVADVLTHFPYLVQDEIFYVAYSVEQRASILGSSLVRNVKQALLSSEEEKDRGSASESNFLNLMETAETGHSSVLAKLCQQPGVRGNQSSSAAVGEIEHGMLEATVKWAESTGILQQFETNRSDPVYEKARSALITVGPICALLLAVRQHLRDLYSVSDSKLKDYSPSAPAKQWDKPIAVPGRSGKPVTSQLLPLPLLTLHCLRYPNRLKDLNSQTDSLLLWHFVDLCRRLLALEEAGGGGFDSGTVPVSGQPLLVKQQAAVEDNSVADSPVCGTGPVLSLQQPAASKNAVVLDHTNLSSCERTQPPSGSKSQRTQLRQKEAQNNSGGDSRPPQTFEKRPVTTTKRKKKPRLSRGLSASSSLDSSISSLSSASEASWSPPAARKLARLIGKGSLSNSQAVLHRLPKSTTEPSAAEVTNSRRKPAAIPREPDRAARRSLSSLSDDTSEDDVRPQRMAGGGQLKSSCRSSKQISSDSSDTDRPVSKGYTLPTPLPKDKAVKQLTTTKQASSPPPPPPRKQLSFHSVADHGSCRPGSNSTETSHKSAPVRSTKPKGTAGQPVNKPSSSNNNNNRSVGTSRIGPVGRSLAPLPDAILRPPHRQQTGTKTGRSASALGIGRDSSAKPVSREAADRARIVKRMEDDSRKRRVVGGTPDGSGLHDKSKVRATDNSARGSAVTASSPAVMSAALKTPSSLSSSKQKQSNKSVKKVRRLSDSSSSSSAADEKHFRATIQSSSESSVSSPTSASSSGDDGTSSTTSSDDLSTSSNSSPPIKAKRHNSSR